VDDDFETDGKLVDLPNFAQEMKKGARQDEE
jgi:hypothetical protein